MKQLAALIWLRSRIWRHGLRSHAVAADTAVRIVLAALAALLSTGLAFALAGITHVGLLDGTVDAVHMALSVVLWVLGFVAVVMPVILGAGQVQVPIHRFLAFPLGRWQLYRTWLLASVVGGANLFWYPILAAVSVVALVFHDVPATLWLPVVGLLAACFVIWLNTILTIVQWVLRKRNVRELAVLIGLVLVVVVSMLPAVVQEEAEQRGKDWFGDLIPQPVNSVLVGVASIFPPSIAARGLEGAVLGQPGHWMKTIVWLAVWTVVGVVIGFGVVRRDLADGGRTINSRRHSAAAAPGLLERLSVWMPVVLPAPVRAVAAKEVRYLLRSTVGKFNIVIMPLFVILVALVMARDVAETLFGLDRESLVFVGLMIYASMFSNNFLFNAYAWEGAGAQCYFSGPAQPAQVILGKNLGVWLYSLLLCTVAVAVFCLISGIPSVSVLISGCLAFVVALLLATMVGNYLSPVIPVPREISSITNSPSQTAVLATFGLLLVDVFVIGGCLTIPSLAGSAWLGQVLLAGLTAFEIGLYLSVLRPAGRLLESRRESLIEALQT